MRIPVNNETPSNGKNGRGLLIGGGIGLGGSVLVTIMGMGWNAIRADLAETRIELRELRADLKEIQKLAAERGKAIPDLERRIEKLEKYK